ncbi:hypothetical protein LUZ62_059517 [Rhynchospora pubera]|uniref:Neprosin PEP catalytic domain-containing protein n=1 Tax=Rhynchospora pubera TaxID=906938 RepID=A0AAV8E762_9POAL|nr:hypothetical protein LUZ62_059517 [Rhynchospora pubera]
MALKSVFVLLFLSYTIVAGLVTHHAGYVTYDGAYYGAQARISAWGVPDMNPDSNYEVSLTLINLNGDPNGDRISVLKVGLHVFPRLYHNNRLRIFTLWSDNAAKNTGCYNTDCPGFVVANSSAFYPGQAISPLSQYGGTDEFITFSIKKDTATQLWTLYREDYGTSIKFGWWKKGILAGLEDKADSVQWGAFVDYPDNAAGPPMGSGHFSWEGKHKAAYMSDLKLFDQTGNGSESPNIYDLVKDVDKPDCYTALPASVFDGEYDERHKFYYGGPAGCRN